MNNPYYQLWDTIDLYNERLNGTTPNEENVSCPISPSHKGKCVDISFVDDHDAILIEDMSDYLNRIHDDKEEKRYREEDPIRKFQFEYDVCTTVTQKCPEAFYNESNEKVSQVHIVAPGEG